MAGTAQAKPLIMGMTLFSVQPDFPHELVREEADAGHIAGIFEDGDQSEEDHDLGNKDQDTAKSGQEPIDEQVAPPGRGQVLAQPAADSREGPVDGIHRELGEPEDALEQKEEYDQEDDIAPGPVEEEFVQAFGEEGPFQRVGLRYGVLHDDLDPGVTLEDLLGLDSRMVEMMSGFDLFYPGLERWGEMEMFVVDQVMDSGIVADLREKAPDVLNGARGQIMVRDEIAGRGVVQLAGAPFHDLL